MHVHNVSAYAPPGHRLLRTEYVGDLTRHVFLAPDASERVCEVAATDKATEVAALEAFCAALTPAPEPEAAAEPEPIAAPAKPSRKRS